MEATLLISLDYVSTAIQRTDNVSVGSLEMNYIQYSNYNIVKVSVGYNPNVVPGSTGLSFFAQILCLTSHNEVMKNVI